MVSVRGGVFTHELLSALSGAADVNADRRVEYSEVQAFIASANRAIHDPRAVPRIVAFPPAIDHHRAIVALADFGSSTILAGKIRSAPSGTFGSSSRTGSG